MDFLISPSVDIPGIAALFSSMELIFIPKLIVAHYNDGTVERYILEKKL